jgi:cholesterol 7-dehydrogenase
MQRIPLPPYPNGWFAVSHSDELAKGQVRTVRALGREVVVYRGQSGQAFAVDPYCAHLGAHLGVGGTVQDDDSLRCPFHGWCYDGSSGRCTSIPYTDKIPTKAEVASYRVWENNGFVFVWHHAEGKAPDWTPDIVEELADPAYTLWGKKDWRIASHPQEIMAGRRARSTGSPKATVTRCASTSIPVRKGRRRRPRTPPTWTPSTPAPRSPAPACADR